MRKGVEDDCEKSAKCRGYTRSVFGVWSYFGCCVSRQSEFKEGGVAQRCVHVGRQEDLTLVIACAAFEGTGIHELAVTLKRLRKP